MIGCFAVVNLLWCFLGFGAIYIIDGLACWVLWVLPWCYWCCMLTGCLVLGLRLSVVLHLLVTWIVDCRVVACG